MTVTKTARQKLRNNTRYYDYTLTLYRDVLENVNRTVLAETIPHEDSTLPVAYPSQSFSQKETAIVTR